MLRRGNGTRCVVSYCIAVSPGGKRAERSDAYSRSCELVHKVTRGLGSVDLVGPGNGEHWRYSRLLYDAYLA